MAIIKIKTPEEKITLVAPITITKTVANVQVTAVIYNIEEARAEIHYITFLDDGTPFQRGNIAINDPAAIKLSFEALDEIIATGKTLEVAAAEYLQSQVLAAWAE